MNTRPERITSATALIALAGLTLAGVAVAVVGLATSSPGDDGPRAAYVAGLVAALVVALLLATLLEGRRRALMAARVRAGELERSIELAARGRGDDADPKLRAATDELVARLLQAGAYADAERLALAVANLSEPAPPVRLGAAS